LETDGAYHQLLLCLRSCVCTTIPFTTGAVGMRGGPDINLRDRWRRPLIDSLDSLLCASAAALGCFDILQLGRPYRRALILHSKDRLPPMSVGLLEHGLIHRPSPPATETPETAVFD
jgi:hypothetical protein